MQSRTLDWGQHDLRIQCLATSDRNVFDGARIANVGRPSMDGRCEGRPVR